MKEINPIKEKSYAFALRTIKLYKHITNKYDNVIAKQLLRSGTSIGANIKEAIQAQSKADFISKLSIALKEASESEYWIQLLGDADYLSEAEAKSILTDCQELIKLLTSIIKTAKDRYQ